MCSNTSIEITISNSSPTGFGCGTPGSYKVGFISQYFSRGGYVSSPNSELLKYLSPFPLP